MELCIAFTQCTRLHRVLLLQSDKHTEQLVVKAITTAIPGTSQDHALNCYNTAEKLGQAMITSSVVLDRGPIP